MAGFDVFFGLFLVAGVANSVLFVCAQDRPNFYYADEDAVTKSKPNWGWPQTVGYENPTGPEVSYLQIFYSLPPIRWLLGNGPAKNEARKQRIA